MTRIVEFRTSATDKTPILVAVDAVEDEITPVSRGDDGIKRVSKESRIPRQVDQTFDSVADLVVRGCRPLSQAFQELSQECPAKSAAVEFGISFSAEGSIYLVKSSGAATLKVTVTWDFSANP